MNTNTFGELAGFVIGTALTVLVSALWMCVEEYVRAKRRKYGARAARNSQAVQR